MHFFHLVVLSRCVVVGLEVHVLRFEAVQSLLISNRLQNFWILCRVFELKS